MQHYLGSGFMTKVRAGGSGFMTKVRAGGSGFMTSVLSAQIGGWVGGWVGATQQGITVVLSPPMHTA